jgi:hypothetical protein
MGNVSDTISAAGKYYLSLRDIRLPFDANNMNAEAATAFGPR